MARQSSWPFSSNQFDVATNGSFRKMNVVSEDYDTRLLGIDTHPGIALLYAEFHPFRQEYWNQYSAWKTKFAGSVASTQKVYEMLNQLSGPVIRNWDARVASEYDERSYQYRSLLPNGRIPFYSGGIDERIAEIKSLHNNMLAHTGLAIVAADVLLFLDELKTARQEQNANSGALKASSDDLEAQRKITAAEMYAGLGTLMRIHKHNSLDVEKYFDLQLLRSDATGESDEIAPAAVVAVRAGETVESGLTMVPDIKLRLVNSGESSVRVCMSADPTTPCADTVGKVLKPGEEMEATPAILGKPDGGFLNVTNLSDTLSGEVKVFVTAG